LAEAHTAHRGGLSRAGRARTTGRASGLEAGLRRVGLKGTVGGRETGCLNIPTTRPQVTTPSSATIIRRPSSRAGDHGLTVHAALRFWQRLRTAAGPEEGRVMFHLPEHKDGREAAQDIRTTQCLRRGPHRRRPQSRTPSHNPEGDRSRTGSQVGTALSRYRGEHIGSVLPL
jgi:hypothetical protein